MATNQHTLKLKQLLFNYLYNLSISNGSSDKLKPSGRLLPIAMFRAILPDGDLTAARYEEHEHGVDLFTDADELLAFVPYANLVALVNEEVEREAERSIM